MTGMVYYAPCKHLKTYLYHSVKRFEGFRIKPACKHRLTIFLTDMGIADLIREWWLKIHCLKLCLATKLISIFYWTKSVFEKWATFPLPLSNFGVPLSPPLYPTMNSNNIKLERYDCKFCVDIHPLQENSSRRMTTP